MENKRLIITLIIVSLLVGLIYSTSNILNSYYSHTNDEFNFLPIGEFDDLFYYSYIRELLDGNIFSGDSQILKYKAKFDISTSYGISFIFTGLSSWITGDVVSGYYINRFIFPIINFILSFLLLRFLTKSILFSIICSLLIIFFHDYFSLSFPYLDFTRITSFLGKNLAFDSFNNGFYRTPSLAFTNIVSLLSLASFYFFIKGRKINSFLFICFILVVSAYTYPVTFVICGCIYLIAFIYSLRQKLVGPRLIYISTFSIFIGISPIAYIYLDTIINLPAYYAQINELLIGFYGGNIRGNLYHEIRYYVMYDLLGILLLHLFDISPYRKANTLFFLAVIFTITVSLFLFGANSYYKFIGRGILPIFLVIMFSISYYTLKSLLTDKKLIIRFYDTNRVNIAIDLTNTVNRLIIYVQDRRTVTGIVLVILGIICNEKTIASLFTNDGSIDVFFAKIFTWAFQVFCILLGIIIIFYEKLCEFIKSRPHMFFNIKFIKNILVYFLIVFTLITALASNIQTTKAIRYQWYNDRRNLRGLFKKLNESTKKNDIIMTVDPEIQFRIPVYTHFNLYNPNIINSSFGFMGREERVNRLYDAMTFFKINPEALKYLLENRYESPYGYTEGISFNSLEYFPYQFWIGNYYWYPKVQKDIDAIVDLELDAYGKHDYDRDKLINNIDYFLTSSFTSNIYRNFPAQEKIDYSMYEKLFSYKEFTVYKAEIISN